MPLDYLLRRMTESDAGLTVDWMVSQYGFDPDEVRWWVRCLHFNWDLSVKALDVEGRAIGLLNMSDYRIEEETEQMIVEQPLLLSQLNELRYVAVFSFIVAEPYRGTRLNYDMIRHIWDDLQTFDFVFIPVMHRLKTHSYWKRWGAVEFYRDGMSVYYMLPFSAEAKRLADELMTG
ncbi:MAG: hypothetical protein IJK84_00165 [Bacteroidales bacterium]|nr:hypothetical protein [Bacteroidales bacterium]